MRGRWRFGDRERLWVVAVLVVACSRPPSSVGDTGEVSDSGTMEDDGSDLAPDLPGPGCGNGEIEGTEQCDDGNDVDGDGCDTCVIVDEVLAIEAGGPRACATLRGGRIRCWGSELTGGQDKGDDEPARDADPLPLGMPAQSIAVWAMPICAVLDGGGVKCWRGVNLYGELGQPTTETWKGDVPPDNVVPVGMPVTHVEVGDRFACALTDQATVRCWGYVDAGRLGYGTMQNIGLEITPAEAGDVPVGMPVIQLASGNVHTCALGPEGTVRCWGQGVVLGYGQSVATVGDDEPASALGDVPIGEPVVQIASGGQHACAVSEGGSLYCWGEAWSGQLGYGSDVPIGYVDTPADWGPVPVGEPVLEVAAGDRHTCVRLEGGRVKCWGSNGFGALGQGHTDGTYSVLASESPDVELPGPVAGLSLGQDLSCARMEDGTAHCWGNGAFGALGHGNLPDCTAEPNGCSIHPNCCLGDDEPVDSWPPVPVF